MTNLVVTAGYGFSVNMYQPLEGVSGFTGWTRYFYSAGLVQYDGPPGMRVGLMGSDIPQNSPFDSGTVTFFEITRNGAPAVTLTGFSLGMNVVLGFSDIPGAIYDWLLAGNDSLTGAEMNDTLVGFAGEDSLYGKGGNDTLNGGYGVDRMEGGLGDDFYVVETIGDLVVEKANEGRDIVYQTLLNYTLPFGVEDSTMAGTGLQNLVGNSLDNLVHGNDAANIFNMQSGGYDRIEGHGGDDTYYLDDVDWVVEQAGEGVDRVFTSGSFDARGQEIEFISITGTAAANVYNGGSGVTTINGNNAANTMDGGAGADYMRGFDGDDRYFVDNVGDQVIEAKTGGLDNVVSSVTYAVTDTYVEWLTLAGSANINGTGNNLANILWGNAGINVLTGAKGDDAYYVQNTGDTVVEAKDQGTDLVYSTVSFVLGASSYVENLNLTGSANINGTGNNIANVITGNAGINVLTGYKGDDVYYVQNTGDTVIEAKDQGTDLVCASVSFTLGASSYVERLTLTGSANLNGTGNNIANILTGNAGINVLTGAKGDDIYYVQNTGDTAVEAKDQGTDLVYSSVSFVLGASSHVEQLTLTGSANLNATGNNIANVLTGNAGINVLTGAKGDDIYYVQNTGDTVVEAKDQGTDLVYSSVSFVLGASSYVEQLTLTGSANLNGTGNNIANVLTGNSGINVLTGAKGDDIYYVQNTGDTAVEAKDQGTDLVYSSVTFTLGASSYVENLTLTGSADINGTGNNIANVLTGNSGINVLTGAKGADTFVWSATSHSTVARSDLIADLTNSDYIDLSRIDANVNAGGTQHFVLVDAFTNTAGQVTLTYSSSTNITSLRADTNGDGVADMLIRITGDHEDFDNFIFGG